MVFEYLFAISAYRCPIHSLLQSTVDLGEYMSELGSCFHRERSMFRYWFPFDSVITLPQVA